VLQVPTVNVPKLIHPVVTAYDLANGTQTLCSNPQYYEIALFDFLRESLEVCDLFW
jgi:hypothetical protein